MKHKFTVFTTTFNRVNLLQRLYHSLQAQTCQDFIWLIVDDGSTDGTKDFVAELQEKGDLTIDYHYKSNGGKHTAMKLGFSLVQTPYMVEIDDDDELLPLAIETFDKEWTRVEEQGYTDIAEIRALSINDEGVVSGNYHPQKDNSYFDSNYFTMDWIQNKHLECITCWRMNLVKTVALFDVEHFWLYDKVKLISESLFWNRLAKKYNTRYLFTPLRLYHADAGDSITLASFSRQKCFNYVFSLHVIINEMGKAGWKNPSHLVKFLAEYMACGSAVGISPFRLTKQLERREQKAICWLLAPLAYVVGFKFKLKF